MAFHVILQPRAHRDIEEAFEWIHDRSPARAVRWLEEIQATIQSLETKPDRCALAPEGEQFGREIRQLLYGKRKNVYRILFVIEDEMVSVLTVRHGARDLWRP